MKIAIIGAGFLGCSLSLVLSKKNQVDLYEKTGSILSGASSYNQMRFHGGYHYPRSQKTFNEIKKSKKDFIEFFSNKIFENTQNFYSIPFKKTKTSPKKYVSFMKRNNLFFKNYINPKYFSNNINKSFRVKEKILNYFKFKNICRKKLIKANVNIKLNKVFKKKQINDYDKIFVCTYSENNRVIKDLGFKIEDNFRYELVEKIIIKLPDEFKNKSFVVIDGNFVCCDPYLGTNYHLLSDVYYSKIEIKKCKEYKFKSNKRKFANKTPKKNLKFSNFSKFINNSSKFLPFLKDAKYIKSMFTIRTLLSNKEKTDERTSNVKQISDKLYVVLTGKWNTTVKIAKNIEQNLLNE